MQAHFEKHKTYGKCKVHVDNDRIVSRHRYTFVVFRAKRESARARARARSTRAHIREPANPRNYRTDNI